VSQLSLKLESLHSASMAAVNVWSGVVDPLVDKMERYFPDPEDRAKFSKRVQDDMRNESHHFYAILYDIKWID
jgi:hypothetical protein